MNSVFTDLEALRLDTTAAVAGAVEVLTHVPVRKPTRTEFIRVHPEPEYSLDTTVFTDKEENETYLVAPGMRAELVGETRPVLLRTCLNRQGVLFIWPVPLPTEDGRRFVWHDTAREAMRHATEHWVRVASDMAMGCYRIYEAEGQLTEPVWPEKSFQELLELAFAQRVIGDSDHPLVRRLRGLN